MFDEGLFSYLSLSFYPRNILIKLLFKKYGQDGYKQTHTPSV